MLASREDDEYFTRPSENDYSLGSHHRPEARLGVTIKDVAREANVSVATVSRALNGHENVADEVRKRVMSVAGELRYSPHHAARSLSSRRTHTIGVVLPDLYGEFFSELMRGIDQVARERGLHLLVSSYHGHPEEQGAALLSMRGRVDGLLVMSPMVDNGDHLTRNLAPGLPVVLINTDLPESGHAAFCIDNYGGARRMSDYLIASGHRRIAFIAGPDDNFDARERLRGYLDAVAAGLPEAGPWVVPGDFDEASGHRAGHELLSGQAPPDAVFAANDMMALGCLYAFSQRGVRVPEDISLAGFDDIPLARYVHPALTTMRVDIADLGGRALRALLEPGRSDGVDIWPAAPAPELVVRDSSLVRTDATRRDSS